LFAKDLQFKLRAHPFLKKHLSWTLVVFGLALGLVPWYFSTS